MVISIEQLTLNDELEGALRLFAFAIPHDAAVLAFVRRLIHATNEQGAIRKDHLTMIGWQTIRTWNWNRISDL